MFITFMKSVKSFLFVCLVYLVSKSGVGATKLIAVKLVLVWKIKDACFPVDYRFARSHLCTVQKRYMKRIKYERARRKWLLKLGTEYLDTVYCWCGTLSACYFLAHSKKVGAQICFLKGDTGGSFISGIQNVLYYFFSLKYLIELVSRTVI